MTRKSRISKWAKGETCSILGCEQLASNAPVNPEIGPVCQRHEDEAK